MSTKIHFFVKQYVVLLCENGGPSNIVCKKFVQKHQESKDLIKHLKAINKIWRKDRKFARRPLTTKTEKGLASVLLMSAYVIWMFDVLLGRVKRERSRKTEEKNRRRRHDRKEK